MVIRKAGYDTGKDHKVFRGDKLETCIVVLFALKFSTVLLGPPMQDLKLNEIMDHVYLRHLSTECRSILSADIATDTQPIYRPTLGRYVSRVSVDMLF